MVLSLGSGEQFANIIVAKTSTKSQGPRLRLVWFGSRRPQNFIQAEAQGGVDHFFERFAKFGRASLCFGCHIGIKRQGCSHIDIMMLISKMSRCIKCAIALQI
jgi:hypothetical protein